MEILQTDLVTTKWEPYHKITLRERYWQDVKVDAQITTNTISNTSTFNVILDVKILSLDNLLMFECELIKKIVLLPKAVNKNSLLTISKLAFIELKDSFNHKIIKSPYFKFLIPGGQYEVPPQILTQMNDKIHELLPDNEG